MSYVKSIKDEDQIYNRIFSAILEQRLTPSMRLREETLCEIFDTSRRIIRRVLRRLSYEGIITLVPNKGAQVTSPSIEQAKQTFMARQAIENIILNTCIAHITAHDIAELRQCVTDENQARKNNDQLGWIRKSGEFHLMIAKKSNNSHYIKFLTELIAHSSLVISLYGAEKSSFCDDHNHDHHNLVDAIEAHDLNKAQDIMSAHLEECISMLEKPLKHSPHHNPDLQQILSIHS